MRAWGVVALVVYAALLLLLRPATPFEWDEVQFQQALDRYDVGQHWPHPPGYPVYIAAGKLVRLVVRDPLLALEAVGVLAAALTLVLMLRTMRRLGAPQRGAVAAAVVLALNPAFAFYANVGLSDVPGVAAAFAAVLALLWAFDTPKRLPFAAIVCALALGVRPQLAAVMAPLGVFVLVRELRERRWREVGLASAAGLATTAACWVPAILLTGAGRFVNTLRLLSAWVATEERGYRLPAAPVNDVLAFWLVRPFGSGVLAALFWVLVLVGARAWWRRGQHRLVVVATTAASCYLLSGMFSMNYTTAVRYGLPALPFLAILAAGVINLERPTRRVVGGAVLGVSTLGGAVWVAPPFVLRTHPAPVWEALDWITQHCDRSKTVVVVDGAIKPHGTYVLSRASVSYTDVRPTNAYDASVQPRKQVLVVAETPIPGFPVVFERRWDSSHLRRLTRNRYYTCVVMAMPEPDQPVFSPEWRFENGRWRLLGTGLVHLPPTARPVVLRLCAGDDPLGVT
ncbi:MAG: glycosyltransferase family 39 protein, partial [Thermoanaerobaculales bacterium]